VKYEGVSLSSKPSMRIPITAILVIVVIISAFVGYFAGSAAAVPRTVTITETVAPSVVTTTVTKTEKVTITETVTVTPTPTSTPPPKFPLPHWPKEVIIRASGAAGSWTILMMAVANVLERELGVRFRIEFGGSLVNVIAVAKGDADIGITWSLWIPTLSDPELSKLFAKEVLDLSDVRLLVADICEFGFLWLVARPDFPANTSEEVFTMLKEGKPVRVGVGGSKGAIEDAMFSIIFPRYYGYDPAKYIAVFGDTPSVQALIEGKADVIFDQATPGIAAYHQLAMALPNAKLIKLSEKDVNLLMESMRYSFEKCVLPVGLYDFVKEEYPSLCTKGILIARKELPEDLAYYIVKVIDEHQSEIKAASANFNFNPSTAWSSPGLELHPGAAKYFKEKGYMK